MQRIISGRGIGKTKALMEETLRNNGVFVCQNVLHMREKANAYGLHGLSIISYRDFINNIQDYPLSYAPEQFIRGYKDEEDRNFYIDELEGFVQFLCLNKFAGYTLSLE